MCAPTGTVQGVRRHHTDGQPVSRRVHQAARMISGQLGIDEHEAIGRMVVRASATDVILEFIALDVLDGVIRFT